MAGVCGDGVVEEPARKVLPASLVLVELGPADLSPAEARMAPFVCLEVQEFLLPDSARTTWKTNLCRQKWGTHTSIGS